MLSTEAIARIQQRHNALDAATSGTAARSDVRLRDVLVGTEYDVATQPLGAHPVLPAPERPSAQLAVMQGVEYGLRPPQFLLNYAAALRGMADETAGRITRTSSPHYAILRALEDVSTWYAHLSANGVIELTPAQAQTHQCSISHEPFDQLTHPVGVLSADVLHVFEGADLLTWMKHQTEPPRADDPFTQRVATHPLSRQPLHLSSLQPVRVQTPTAT